VVYRRRPGAPKGSQNSAASDFSLGTVNALVDQMFVGLGASQVLRQRRQRYRQRTLTFSAGTIDVNTPGDRLWQGRGGPRHRQRQWGSLIVNTTLELFGHGTDFAERHLECSSAHRLR